MAALRSAPVVSRAGRTLRAIALVQLSLSLAAAQRTPAQRTLTVDPDGDPQAEIDPFLSLSSAELHRHWSFDGEDESPSTAPTSLGARMHALNTMHDVTYVDVRLVGFEGDGNLGMVVGEPELQRLLDALPAVAAPHVMHPEPGERHSLPVSRRFVYAVSRAPKSLAAAVAGAISSGIQHHPHTHGTAAAVGVSAVDNLIRDDYVRRRTSHVVLYFLNPPSPRRRATDAEVAQQQALARHQQQGPGAGAGAPDVVAQQPAAWYHTLQYQYVDDGDEANATHARHPSHGVEGSSAGARHAGACPTTKWVGTERYAWIDLSAGPVAYGSSTAADGVVTEHTMPRITRYRSLVEADPTRAARELTVELAALVHDSSRFLLAPPMWRQPRRTYDVVKLVVVVVHAPDAGGVAPPPFDAAPLLAQLPQLASSSPSQRVDVVVHNHTFDSCRLCAAAYAAAIKSHTSAVRDGSRASGLRSQVHPYLSSKELAAWLDRFGQQMPGLAPYRFGAHNAKHHTAELVVPAFVYSLAEPMMLLLDRFHQAVATRDMVLAVQSRAGLAKLDDACAGSAMLLETARASRGVLGALLQAGWGVAPSDLAWSAAHNASEPSLLWAVGRTPFGPYSARAQLSFALRDAAARHALHARAAEVLAEVHELAGYYAEFGVEVDAVLREGPQLTLLRRLNVLRYKLERAGAYLSLHNFGHARYYLLSTRHDLGAMRELLAQGAQALGSRLVCS